MMFFNTLNDSAERGELMLVDGGMCHWHLRRDGQLTIREIISTRKGAGRRILRRLELTPGATSLFAKCPVSLPSNAWYGRQGFHVERMETLNSGAKVLHWRKWLDTHRWQPTAHGIEIVYSSGGNPRFTEIAIDAGWLPGSQLPETVYYQPYFVDQNWKAPNFEQYAALVEKHRPYMATVIDWTHDVEWSTVIEWCERLAPLVAELIVIPKIPGTIERIPETLYGKPVRLGYSVPTRYGGTTVSLGEFRARRVHLLGGAPEKQLELARFLNVVSIDGNYAQKMASSINAYWIPVANIRKSTAPHFVRLDDLEHSYTDAPYEAFRRSCHNIMEAWRQREQRQRQQVGAQYTLAI